MDPAVTEHRRGAFITFEGPDGAGKTTGISYFVTQLEALGHKVTVTREPGGTPLGETLREQLLKTRMCLKAEMLLFAAQRAEHLHQVIMPALERGEIVVCDRFADSTYAYQGGGRRAPLAVEKLEEFVLEGFEPDYTLFFDISLEESLKRLGQRADNNIFDDFARQFKKDVYFAYRKRFLTNPQRMHRIDAMGDINSVRLLLLDWIHDVFVPRQTDQCNIKAIERGAG